MNLKLNDYLNLNREGIFPGPTETEDEFHRRIQRLRTDTPLPQPLLTKEEWSEVHTLTETIFDIRPFWIPAFYQNKKISIWEAGAAWDFQGVPVVQLRTQLMRGRWLLVCKQEVLAHEAAHAARMNFRENRFEEILCYKTSKLPWRRQIGPLFRQPWEAGLCASFAAMSWVFGILGMFLWALILPWLPLIFFSLRLMRDHHILGRCLANMRPFLLNPEQAVAVALRLSDSEIQFFAQAAPEDLIVCIQDKASKELRWRVLASAYFMPFPDGCGGNIA